jgi:cell division protein FtsQ
MSKKQKIVRVAALFAFFGFIITLFGFVGNKRGNATISSVAIQIDNSEEVRFLNETEVKTILQERNLKTIGATNGKLEPSKMEQALLEHPAVKSANVYTGFDGVLHIEIEQRKPIVRVLDLLNNSYYIDKEGNYFPTLERFTCRVPVATGFITDRFHTRNMTISEVMANDSLSQTGVTDDIYTYMQLIQRDELLMALTEQLYVNVDGEIELIPKAGPTSILLGTAEQAENKLSRLKVFYRKGLPAAGWDIYSALNLKYKDQIICTKKPH